MKNVISVFLIIAALFGIYGLSIMYYNGHIENKQLEQEIIMYQDSLEQVWADFGDRERTWEIIAKHDQDIIDTLTVYLLEAKQTIQDQDLLIYEQMDFIKELTKNK